MRERERERRRNKTRMKTKREMILLRKAQQSWLYLGVVLGSQATQEVKMCGVYCVKFQSNSFESGSVFFFLGEVKSPFIDG